MKNTTSEDSSTVYNLVHNPLFWTSLAQCTITVFMLVIVVHVWVTTKKTTNVRLKNINWKIQLVEQRLRLQEPNVNLIERMAAQMNVTVEEVGEDSQTILNKIWDDRSKEKEK
ncbi:hypothetical protein Y032_0074g805 [Ancylostoma ceylanicum]|uniref:Uncharacterized protein n=1 Tax=Ancylostoma ceylanicum TaxID=53326 RepID=A0A016TVH6_9BILA|nr:hypothetical protein Y032_0074g805 [Ancylostoma ceylanicum]